MTPQVEMTYERRLNEEYVAEKKTGNERNIATLAYAHSLSEVVSARMDVVSPPCPRSASRHGHVHDRPEWPAKPGQVSEMPISHSVHGSGPPWCMTTGYAPWPHRAEAHNFLHNASFSSR